MGAPTQRGDSPGRAPRPSCVRVGAHPTLCVTERMYIWVLALLLGAVACQQRIPKSLAAEFHESGGASPLICHDYGSRKDLAPALSCASTVFGARESGVEGERGGKHCDMIRDDVFFHAIFDFQRPSSTPLFLNHICRALSLCISAPNFRIILHLSTNSHSSGSEERVCGPSYLSAASFLRDMSIPYTSWTGEFDTMTSQRARLVVLRDLHQSTTSRWILQVDADEMPVFGSPPTRGLSGIFDTLQARGGCDVVYGHLSERVPRDGRFINISLSTSLDSQFPLICNVKERVEKAQSRKLVLYRAAYRAGIGNHRLICEQQSGNRGGTQDAQMTACRKIFTKRADLRALHPVVTKLPQRCDLRHDKIPYLDIEHYKYTWGLEAYLQERVKVFKKNKITWHSESTAVLHHIKEHRGALCVTCQELGCRNVTSRI